MANETVPLENKTDTSPAKRRRRNEESFVRGSIVELFVKNFL